jgi:kumamolisin
MKNGIWAGAAALALLATMAQARERQLLHTHAAATAGQTMGRLPATQQMNVVMTLQLRNEPQLDALLQNLSDPNSPNYRKFLTVSEFTERFAPTPADYEAVVNFATAHGHFHGSRPESRLRLRRRQ